MRRLLLTFALLVCACPAFAQTPTVVQRVFAGHFESAGPSSPPSSVKSYMGWAPTLSGNTSIMVFAWCNNGTTACNSNTTNPPAVSSIVDNNSNNWTSVVSMTNSSDFINSAIYQCNQCGAGITFVTVTFASATIEDFHPVFLEVQNLGALDGTAVSSVQSGPTSITAGSITLTVANDFQLQDCLYVSNGMGSSIKNQTSNPWTGTGVTYAFPDNILDEGVGYIVQAGTGAKSLTFSETGGPAGDFNCVGAAWKAASSGSAHTGIYPDVVYWVSAVAASPQNVYVAIPSGDLLTIFTSLSAAILSAVTDGNSETFTLVNNSTPWPSYAYFANTAGGAPLKLTVTNGLNGFFRIVAWHGIKTTSPGDSSVSCTAPSSTFTASSNIGCKNSAASSVPPLDNMPNITPSANGLVIVMDGLGTGPNGFPTTPASGVNFFCTTYTGETDGDLFCRGDGYAWTLGTASSAETWKWPNANGSTATSSNGTAISFLPAPSGTVANQFPRVQ